MDGLLVYLFAALSVAVWIPISDGSKDGLSVGIALRQGEPSSVISQKNGELLLNCSVEYNNDLGPLDIAWTRNGEPIDLDSKRIQLLQNGSLYFRRIIHRPKKDRTDEGRYKCLVTLAKVGTVIARDVKVQVAGIERKFDIEPQPQTVPLGGVARFQCQIPAVPSAMYIWELNKTKLPQTDNRYLLLNSGILQITGVRASDKGLYRCYATQGLHDLPGVVSDIDGKYSEQAMLDVLTGPVPNQVKIVSSSQNVTAHAGTSAVLECLVQGYTGQVEWRKEGQKLSVQSTGRIEWLGNNLHFLETVPSDDGKYQCVAGNTISSMMLNIISQPVISEEPESVSTPKAQWIYLKCLADGHPKPTISWLKDGEPIDYDKYNYKKRKGDELVIVQSEPYNSGFYQCVATNDAGSTMAITRIDVYMQPNVPGSPTNLRALNVSKTDIILAWDPAMAAVGYPVVAYSVHYKEVGAYEGKDHVIPQPQIELKELSPFSEYAIYIAAYSQAGAGPKSDRLLVRTKESVPSKAPTITLEPRARTIQVNWEPLAEKDSYGIITQYKIFYRRTDDSLSMKVEQNILGTATSYVIRDLEPETDYEVRLLAGTSVGYKTFSDDQWPWVLVKTGIDQDMVAPEIQVVIINETVVNVTWFYTVTTDVRLFSLELKSLPSGDVVNTTILTPDKRYHVLQNLDVNTVYEVSLVAENTDGTSSEAVEEVRTSDVLLPPTPKNLQVTLRTYDSIAVSWFQVASALEITHFTVRYSQWSGGRTSGPVKYLNSDTSSALLEGLLPFTQYQISVRAHSENVFSKDSNPIIEKTLEGVPSEPQNIHIQPVEDGSVNIEWSPPAEPNGNIKSYIIMYSNSLDKKDDMWVRVTKNGSELSATITIGDTSGKIYYFKLLASTETGPGKPTSPIKVTAYSVGEPLDIESKPSTEDDQRLGIIIGISIGVFCIIICVVIILLRHKCLTSNYNQQPQTQPARFHGNGHIPGNGNGHAVSMPENRLSMGLYEMDAYTPMLDHLPENEDSDSKGGGGGNVILTPNGAKLNGFVPLQKNGVKKNGQVHNGHMPSHITTFLPNQYKGEVLDVEETRGLIAAMLGGAPEQCITSQVGEESFTTSRYEDLGSLDDIDHSSCEDVVHKSQVTGREDSAGSGDSGKCSGDSDMCVCDSGEGSISASDSRNSGVYSAGSIPRSDTTDTGDTVVFCGSAACRKASSAGNDCRGNVLPEGTSELPLSPSSRFSSSSWEDTCHDGGTTPGQESPQLPHIQLSTSENSQAPGSDAVVESDNCTNTVTCSSCSSTPPLLASVLVANGAPSATSCYSNNGDPAPHMRSNIDVPPQMYSNGGLRWPQGDYRVGSVENNPNLPHSPLPREIILSHGTRETTLGTLSQIPQDAVPSAAVNSSPRKDHYLA